MSLAAPAAPARAKPLVPAYVIVLMESGPVEFSQAELEAWAADATLLTGSDAPSEPVGAVPAVAFWGRPDDLTRGQRLSFATSEAGRANGVWWAPSGPGGTLLLRSRVGTVNGSAALVQEVGFRSLRPLPAGVVSPPDRARDESPDRAAWLAGTVAMTVVLAAGSMVWQLRRRQRTNA